ncbi:MAG: hypothetical protein ACLFRU_04590 [Paracoccaceae bacterium]
MSAPKTNITKQKRRHRGPLVGIAASVLLAFVLLVLLLGWLWLRTDGPEGAEEQVETPAPVLEESD